MNMNGLIQKLVSLSRELPTLFEVRSARNFPVVTPEQIRDKKFRDEEAHWVFEMVHATVVMALLLFVIVALA